MRILHIITSLRTGGAERLVVELARLHHADGDVVEVLLFDGTRTPLVEELETCGIPVHALRKGFTAMSNPLLLPALVRFLRKHPFDIIHTHNTSCQFLAAMVPGITRVTTEHNASNRRRNWQWFKPVDRWMYSRYKKIVCVGEETRKALNSWLNRPDLDKRMTVIPNGIDLERIRKATPAKEIQSVHGHRILMVSAFRPEKDQQTLLRAMALLPEDYVLFLAGGAETPENRALMDSCVAQAAPMRERVRFLGIRMDVPALLAAADVIVLSSHHEGMSLSMLEGMASGKPMVASDVAGIRELVSGAGLLFPEGDAKALAKMIQYICENPAEAAAVGSRCAARVRQYDIAETARRYLHLYESVINCPG